MDAAGTLYRSATSGEGGSPEPGMTPFTLEMLERALADQQDLTAVERFSQHHESTHGNALESHYRSLMPTSKPKSGQQYGFEVDLDLCTGCKACVSACHSRNGLDEGESFRSVGFLHGGTTVDPWQQTVTTACHHCLNPACLEGCPVLAYDKDPVTGIVRHLDDQCIGCQYCVLTCPYEVPRFNVKKGIVRKCDMCTDRLAVDEAPACVQGCPNGAIAIRLVEVARAAESAEIGALVPGAAPSSITRPTTVYKTKKPAPVNALPADHHAVRPAHDHQPLVVMLVLTQLSVGAFAVERAVRETLPESLARVLGNAHAPFALAIGLLALAASIAHLGRPLGAFRAILGIRHSWLSREILAFGAFANMAMVHAACSVSWLEPYLPRVLIAQREHIGNLVVASGAIGVFCSAMLYHATKRVYWNLATSATKFALTSLVLGLATTMTTLVVVDHVSLHGPLAAIAHQLVPVLVVATALKVAVDLQVLVHLRDITQTDLRRTATLLVGELRTVVYARVLAAFLGAVALPLLFLDGAPSTAATIVGSAMSLTLLLVGEMLERSTFFRAQKHARMPGGLT